LAIVLALYWRTQAPGEPVEEEDLGRMEFLQIYWPVLVVALVIGIVVGYSISAEAECPG
jgi:hypothetical protein